MSEKVVLLKQRRQTGGELPVSAMGAVIAEPSEVNGSPDCGLIATSTRLGMETQV